jgi:hypothetical protein
MSHLDPDIWGAVVPAWIGGVGGLIAAVVSAVALIKSLKTQGGVETLKSAANASSTSRTQVLPQSEASGAAGMPAASPGQSPISWTAWHETRSRYRLRNDSTPTGASARLTGFKDITPGGDDAASYAGPLPVELAPNESVPFTIDKSLVSPSVTAIELTWEDSDGTERERTLYI